MRLTEFVETLYSVNKWHDITGIHDINGNFPYDNIFRKNHSRLYCITRILEFYRRKVKSLGLDF